MWSSQKCEDIPLKKWLCTFLFVVAFSNYGCKPEGSSSDVKFDQTISDKLDVLDLSRTAIEKICTTNPIFIFVGNNERTFAETTRKITFGSTTLASAIQKSVEWLENALEHMPIECDLAMPRDDEKKISAMLLVITDGPSRNDTRIFTRWYDFDRSRDRLRPGKKLYSSKWGSHDRKYYTISADGKLEPSDKKEPLTEIHLPTQLESVVKQAMDFKAPKNPNFKFDQTIYLIKSHGGRFVSARKAPTMDSYFQLVNGKGEGKYSHAFLFDGNGPKVGTLTSEIYYPFIKKERACKAIDKLTSDSAPSRKICSACEPYIDTGSKGFLATKCNAQTVASKDKSGGGTLSPEMNDTLSPEMNDTLSPEMNDTLSPEMNDTLSPEMNDTLSPEMNDTLSAGKSSLFSVKPADYAEWDEVDQMASAVSYSGSGEIDGLHKMKLPLAGDGSTVPMIVLDSCWGSSEIANDSFQLLGKTQGSVVVLNPNPMGVLTMNYGSLNYLQYLMLPYIQSEYHEGKLTADSDKIRKAKVELDNYLAENGLIGMNEKDMLALTDSSKKPEIYFVKDGKAKK
jgi:hypothetical protein